MKALALLSGGLDSALAVRVILDQGIEVEALKFTSPFCNCDHGGKCFSAEAARELDIPIKNLPKGEGYLEVIMNPQYGYGAGINPCIDCRIFMLKKAKEYADNIGADFIITGEVLGQRPMSQHRRAMELIEKKSGLEGRLLRPLCAQYFTETDAEQKGLVDRSKLLSLSGRSRKPQLEMAKNFNISMFSCGGGGCLLTDKNFARKMRDFIDNSNTLTLNDIALLKSGRHFRHEKNKIIVGRNESENRILAGMRNDSDSLFFTPDVMGPTTILQGNMNDDSVMLAARMTAVYSDAPDGDVKINYGYSLNETASLTVRKTADENFLQLLI